MVVGDGCCGKTSLLSVYAKDHFPEKVHVGLSVAFIDELTSVEVDGKEVGIQTLLVIRLCIDCRPIISFSYFGMILTIYHCFTCMFHMCLNLKPNFLDYSKVVLQR